MPLYIGDWLKDTQHLDATTNGAYWFLIMAHWGKHGVSSDDEHLRQIARVREIDWARVKGTLQPFFVELDGLWINRRCVEEYESATSAYRRNCERTAAANAARNDERNVSRNGDVTSYVTKHVNPPSTYHVNPPLTSRQSQSQSQSQPQPHINNELGESL